MARTWWPAAENGGPARPAPPRRPSSRPRYVPPSTGVGSPVIHRACSSTGTPGLPELARLLIVRPGWRRWPTGGIPSPAASAPGWSCRPGCTEFTVTPSRATSSASVLRKPVTPARCSTGSGRRWAGARHRRDGDDPARPPRLHGRHGGLAHGDGRQQVQVERRRIGLVRSAVVKPPAGGPPALVTRMSTPPRPPSRDERPPALGADVAHAGRSCRRPGARPPRSPGHGCSRLEIANGCRPPPRPRRRRGVPQPARRRRHRRPPALSSPSSIRPRSRRSWARAWGRRR